VFKKREEEGLSMGDGGVPHMADAGRVVKGTAKVFKKMFSDDVLPMVTRDANLASFLEPSKIQQRLYHGTTATEGGKRTEAIKRIKASKEGSLGSGVYLTPSSAHASGYSGVPNDDAIAAMLASEHHADTGLKALNQRNSGNILPSQEGGNMLPVHAQIRNPLVIEGTHGDPMIEALTKLGMDEDKATRMVERAYDQKGYIGKEVESRARAAGYDGLAQYRNGELSEVVAYDPNTVKSAIGNRGTYDLNEPDLNKADGGKMVKGASKVFKKLFADEAPAIEKLQKAANIELPAPSIIIPSKISNVKEAVRQSKGDFGARRVERAADEIPNLEQMYREEALRQAFTGDNAKGLMTINPSDFERYATPLMPREKPWPGTGPKKENLPTDEYVNYLAGVDEYHDVPFLEINKQEYGLPLIPFISGHEGRHRNRAMAQRGEKAGLVQLLPRSELREPFPRRSQEEYLQALRDELEMTGNVVVPQPNIFTPNASERQAIKLPDVYAEGGDVHMADAGRVIKGIANAGKKLFQEAEPLALKIKPPSDNVLNVRQSNFMHSRPVGNQTVKIDDLSGGVRMSDPTERQRVKELASKIASPDGYISRIIVDQDNNVIEGQHRLEALRQLGVQDVPVYKIEDLEATMPVDKMKSAMTGVGPIHSDHVNQLIDHALEHISEGGIDNARQMNYGKFQNHYNAALDAIESKANGGVIHMADAGRVVKGVGKVFKKLFEDAPQAEALKLAQERAALPPAKGGLGLPKDNTPEQRAKAMGFDRDTYHGSFRDIKKLDPGAGSTESHAGKGVYSTDSPEDASRNYASIYGPDVSSKVNKGMDDMEKHWPKTHRRMSDEMLTPRQQEIILKNTTGADNLGVVYPLKIRSNKSIHLDAPEKDPITIGPFEHYDEAADAYVDTPHTAKFNEALDEFRELGGEANPIYETVQDYGGAIPARDVFNAVKKTGSESGLYDPYTGDIVSGGVAAGDFIKHFGVDEIRHTPQFKNHELNIGNEHTISLDPDNVRSRFAAFDPWRKTAAIAATMGVAAPDLLAKDKKEKKKAEGGGVFKKLQFMDKGGLTTSGGTFSPEELGVSADEIGLSKEQWETAKRNAPIVARKVGKMAKDELLDEYNQFKSLRGMKDFALRTGASYLGGIPDLVNLGLMIPDAVAGTNLASEKPWFGSEQYIEKMKQAGMLGENEFPLAEIAAGILAPAGMIKKGIKKGSQLFKGAKEASETPKKRVGGLTAMAR